MIGFSKSGLPGSGILAVPMLAAVFGPRLSVGSALPLLLAGDLVAVATYRRAARHDVLLRLLPWIAAGFVLGAAVLAAFFAHGAPDPFGPLIGGLVLAMLLVARLRVRFVGVDRLFLRLGAPVTGSLAGFSTLVSNAAGPLMQIYLVATRLPKDELMGTTAVYFLAVNAMKIPVYLVLAWAYPVSSLASGDTLRWALCVLPVVVVGGLLGRRLLPVIPQRAFDVAVTGLSALGAARLLFL